jgi:hypothetical protein
MNETRRYGVPRAGADSGRGESAPQRTAQGLAKDQRPGGDALSCPATGHDRARVSVTRRHGWAGQQATSHQVAL